MKILSKLKKWGEFMDFKQATKTIENHFHETYAIFHMPVRAFKKFYLAYTGDSVKDDELLEARLLLVKMLLDTLIKDCEVVLSETSKES